MGLVLVLIVLALVFGGVGLLAEAAWWAFVIAAVLFVAGLIAGGFGRRSRV